MAKKKSTNTSKDMLQCFMANKVVEVRTERRPTIYIHKIIASIYVKTLL